MVVSFVRYLIMHESIWKNQSCSKSSNNNNNNNKSNGRVSGELGSG